MEKIEPQSEKTIWLPIIAIAATRMVMSTGFRFIYPFLPVLGRGLGVELTTLTGAISLRSLAAAVGPFLAFFTTGRAGILFGLGLYITGFTAVVIWPTFPMFTLALVLTALGRAVYDPSFHTFVGDRVPYERRGRAIGVAEFSWSLSFIVGVPAMGLLIGRWGWYAPFPMLLGLSVVGFLLLFRLIPPQAAPANRLAGLIADLRQVLGSSTVLLSLAAGLLMNGANELLALVFGVWLDESFGLQIAALGAAALVLGLAELGGESIMAMITDRVGKPRAVAGGLILNGLAVLLLPLIGQSAAGAVAGLFLFYLTFEFALVSFIPLISETAPDARATVMAATAAGLLSGRAIGALAAVPLFVAGGIAATASGVLFVNCLAILALWLATRSANGRV